LLRSPGAGPVLAPILLLRGSHITPLRRCDQPFTGLAYRHFCGTQLALACLVTQPARLSPSLEELQRRPTDESTCGLLLLASDYLREDPGSCNISPFRST
jgi:hypothetical protein